MKGDFSRDTFDPRKHFSAVLMQQGRVQLDADFNEQGAIGLHMLRTLARDLIGPYAAPVENPGFQIGNPKSKTDGDFTISKGRYYVDGILVENDADCTYATQPHYHVETANDDVIRALNKTNSDHAGLYVYLDVWEQHITSVEDPDIREPALGGPDTCTRSKVVWQVKATEIKPDSGPNPDLAELERKRAEWLAKPDAAKNPNELKDLDAQIAKLKIENRSRCDAPIDALNFRSGQLAARIDPGKKYVDPCVTSPEAKYRGTENHLYRIEIHRSGGAGSTGSGGKQAKPGDASNGTQATFKWARDNGHWLTGWLNTSSDDAQPNEIEVASARGFTAPGWVELSDDAMELAGVPGALVKITKVEGNRLLVDRAPGSVPAGTRLEWSDDRPNLKVRVWDEMQRGNIVLQDGAIPVTASSAQGGWIDIEDGLQVRFEPGAQYRSGDYWLIPARVGSEKLNWPVAGTNGDAALTPPKGIVHHYAPLGFITWEAEEKTFTSCRCDFKPLSSCFGLRKQTVEAGPVIITPSKEKGAAGKTKAAKKREKK